MPARGNRAIAGLPLRRKIYPDPDPEPESEPPDGGSS